MYFDVHGKMARCRVRSFLLEQSRVVGPAAGERNYHLFYFMLHGASAEELARHALGAGIGEYRYLAGEREAPGIDDVAEWAQLLHKLELLGFSRLEQASLFQLYSAVLRLGNVGFVPKDAIGDEFKVEDEGKLEQMAKLIQVPMPTLRAKLTSRTLDTGRGSSSYTVPLTREQCHDARDALAKVRHDPPPPPSAHLASISQQVCLCLARSLRRST